MELKKLNTGKKTPKPQIRGPKGSEKDYNEFLCGRIFLSLYFTGI